jgi:acetyltransferase-like isoleucine patch superfamily enzyme
MRRLLRLMARDPAAGFHHLHRGVGILRALWLFRRCRRGPMINAQNRVRVNAKGRIELGERIQFWEGMIPQELVCAEGAELIVGGLSLFNYGVSVRASRSIRIGERCMFGALVQLYDSARERTAPVVIGDDVWVAHGAIVGPGVTIGHDSVVGAGSVVTEDVPARSLAVGNPARCTPLDPSRGDPGTAGPIAVPGPPVL